VGPRAVMGGCGKSCPHRNSIPGPSSPWRVATKNWHDQLSQRVAQHQHSSVHLRDVEQRSTALVATCPAFSSPRVIGVANLLAARLLAGE
jgi:hypothetical protein